MTLLHWLLDVFTNLIVVLFTFHGRSLVLNTTSRVVAHACSLTAGLKALEWIHPRLERCDAKVVRLVAAAFGCARVRSPPQPGHNEARVERVKGVC